MSSRAPAIRPLLGVLDETCVRARQLAGEVDRLVGGSATAVDEALVGALVALERSLQAAASALIQLERSDD